jgi:hypothetical protein
MDELLIFDDDGKGFIRGLVSTDVEFVNPIDYYSKVSIKMHKLILKDSISLQFPLLAPSLRDEDFLKHAIKNWFTKKSEIEAVHVPENFIRLLHSQSKKDQIKLLKGQTLNPDQLIALIFKAWTDFGFSFSQYTATHYHKGLDIGKLPRLINIEGDKVTKVGITPFSDGQLKQVIDQRKVIVAKFLDKGTEWHCFFLTHNSLKGKENWKGGQAHFHYISDKFGLKRSEVLERLKSGDYASTSVHIDLLNYGNQTI